MIFLLFFRPLDKRFVSAISKPMGYYGSTRVHKAKFVVCYKRHPYVGGYGELKNLTQHKEHTLYGEKITQVKTEAAILEKLLNQQKTWWATTPINLNVKYNMPEMDLKQLFDVLVKENFCTTSETTMFGDCVSHLNFSILYFFILILIFFIFIFYRLIFIQFIILS